MERLEGRRADKGGKERDGKRKGRDMKEREGKRKKGKGGKDKPAVPQSEILDLPLVENATSSAKVISADKEIVTFRDVSSRTSPWPRGSSRTDAVALVLALAWPRRLGLGLENQVLPLFCFNLLSTLR